MQLKGRNFTLLLSICGCFIAVAGLVHDDSRAVWIGAVITIVGLILPGKDEE